MRCGFCGVVSGGHTNHNRNCSVCQSVGDFRQAVACGSGCVCVTLELDVAAGAVLAAAVADGVWSSAGCGSCRLLSSWVLLLGKAGCIRPARTGLLTEACGAADRCALEGVFVCVPVTVLAAALG